MASFEREGGRVTQALLREHDAAAGTTKWDIRGELKQQASAAVKATRDNGLFLSQAAQMNVEFVKELFLWLGRRLCPVDLSSIPTSFIWRGSAQRISEDQSFRARVERLIHDADLGIGQLAAKKRPAPPPYTDLVNVRLHVASNWNAEQYTVQTTHSAHDSEEPVEFSLEEDESLGTQRFFAIVGRMLIALDRGDVLVLDELDCSMHPLLTWKLIELFQSDEANPNGAQLLFTTHDSTLMSPSLLRRDQIWFCEKNSQAATQLFSLDDIERTPRKKEAFARNYLAGRYGAVPSFGPALEDFEIR
jgi:hypothetical protein